jgi:hypothetical protein
MINRIMPSTHNDLVSRWIGTRAALQGRNPYSLEVTKEIQTAYYGRPLAHGEDMEPQEFAYPAYVVPLLAPLTWVSSNTARLIFLWLMTPLLAGSVLLYLRSLNLPLTPLRTASFVVLACCSWPVMWGLRLQQLTLPVAALVFTACYLLTRERGAAAGVLLALAMIKPQLVLPMLAWLLVWTFLKRMWSFLAAFALTFAFLLLEAERIVPGWLPLWRADMHGYGPHTALPLETAFGHWAGLATTALLASYCALIVWRLRHSSAGSTEFAHAIALTLAVTLCMTLTKLPVIYNQVLLLPACLVLIHTKPAEDYPGLARRVALAFVTWGYVAVVISVIGETIFRPSALWEALPFQNLLLPVAVTIALTLNASTADQPVPQRPNPSPLLAVAS